MIQVDLEGFVAFRIDQSIICHKNNLDAFDPYMIARGLVDGSRVHECLPNVLLVLQLSYGEFGLYTGVGVGCFSFRALY